MLLGLHLVLYIEGYLYILYVTLSRLIVLYSWSRVNRDTNMSVVDVLCNFNFCFHYMFGPPYGVSNLGGASPLSCSPLHNTQLHIKFRPPLVVVCGESVAFAAK